MLLSIGKPPPAPPGDTRGKADTIGIVQAAIEARGVSYRTRAGEVLVRDISLAVGHGELVALIGGSGSGKTTLLDALSGLRPPTSGTVVRHPADDAHAINGRPAPQIGYVPSGDTIHPVLPLARALRCTAALRSIHVGADVVEEALRVVGLAAVEAPVPVGALNPGERKRAAVAAELLSRPAQLFLEEPTAGLDPAQAAEVLRLLRRLSNAGTTVVLTTSSPLDAVRCDKVALLAGGGHLAFFGTPAAARGYFGADSLEEIYERLTGFGDPAAAWSRRFFQFSRTKAGFTPYLTTPPAPGPAILLPDAAGPHSAGRPSLTEVLPAVLEEQVSTMEVSASDDLALDDLEPDDLARAWAARDGLARGGAGGFLRPVRQLAVLIKRNAWVLTRSSLTQALLAGALVAVLLAFAVLIGAGAFDAPAAGSAWIVFGGFGTGLAFGLPQVRDELGVLRAERFAGLSATGYVLAKAVVLLPALAVADAIVLVVPAACDRLPHGYGPSYVTLLLSSVVALALALLLSAALPVLRPTMTPLAAAWVPLTLLTASLLTLLDHPVLGHWLILVVFAVVLLAGTTVVVARRNPCP